MSKFYKVTAAVYLVGLLVEAVMWPVAAVMVLAKAVGAGMSWAAACSPLFVAIGLIVPVVICKIIIELGGGMK